jgi:hypothetical protein
VSAASRPSTSCNRCNALLRRFERTSGASLSSLRVRAASLMVAPVIRVPSSESAQLQAATALAARRLVPLQKIIALTDFPKGCSYSETGSADFF